MLRTSAPTSGRSACVLYEMLTGRVFHRRDDLRHVGVSPQDRAGLARAAGGRAARVFAGCCAAVWRKIRNGACRPSARRACRSRTLLAGTPEDPDTILNEAATPIWRRVLPWASTAALAVTLAAILLLWAPWRKAVPAAPLSLNVELGADVSVTFGAGDALSLSPDGAVVAFVAQKDAGGSPQLYVRRLDSTAGDAVVGDRRRRESVLFAGRPVDRVFRGRQAEEDRCRWRRRLSRCAMRPTVAAARGARTARSCFRRIPRWMHA